MELLSGAGESEEALLVYEELRDTLSKELAASPLPLRELATRLREEESRPGPLWGEPGTLGGRYAAFTTGGAACRPPQRVWCACLRATPPESGKRASLSSLGRQG